MSKCYLRVNIKPNETLIYLKSQLEADLVHEEYHNIDENRQIGTIVLEKYYMRAGNKIALIVIADNLNGNTEVRAVATASARDSFLTLI